MKMSFRKGEALLTVLVLTTAVLIVMGGVFAYISFSARYAITAVGRDVCRLAAQSEIELAKSAVNYNFQLSLNRVARRVDAGIGAYSASSFDWFQAYKGSSVKRTIGTKNPVTFEESVTNNGCTVQVRIGRVDHETGSQWADVTFVARATRKNPGGTTSEVTIAEMVHFAQQRSAVFNNAYFVNNYGWFKGSGCRANGDVRANGDLYLDTSCVINGKVYAAANEELHVKGDISSTGTMDKRSTYKSTNYSSSSNYGYANRARPLYSDPNLTGTVNSGGYDAPETVTSQTLQDRMNPNQALSVEMPYIGDISSQDSDYRQWAQELHDADPNKKMSTITQGGKTLVSVYYDGVGPSGLTTVKDTYGNTVKAPDYGAKVLVGTDQSPIVINGPVIIPSDVIIKGTVTGQGTIYSGRNIYVVGDIKYANPPTWANKSTQNCDDNKNKDMLGLMAKGNIVLGDASSSSMSSISTYLTQQPYVQKYGCDTSDAAIGYPATFGGSYMAEEYVSSADFSACQTAGLAAFVPGGYDNQTGKFAKFSYIEVPTGEYGTRTEYVRDQWGNIVYEMSMKNGWWTRVAKTQQVKYEITRSEWGAQYDRKYYESVCQPNEISSRASSSISRIDAILYDNHGIFGKIGHCAINGSLVCRNEGILYSSGLYLNWDMRLYSGSSETVSNDKVGLAKSSDAPPQTLWWMEVPNELVDFD